MKTTLRTGALLAGLLALPAVAQDRPPMQPTRDAAVSYRMIGGDGQMRISWLTAQGLQRMEMPAQGAWMVVDTRNSRGFMVMEQARMVMELPDTRDQQGNQYNRLSSTAQTTREGSATVAGTACTIWRIMDQGRETRACITTDGVMLRVVGRDPANPAQESGMEATQVSYAAQDPARFARPAGFQAMQMPGMPPAGGRPAPR